MAGPDRDKPHFTHISFDLLKNVGCFFGFQAIMAKLDWNSGGEKNPNKGSRDGSKGKEKLRPMKIPGFKKKSTNTDGEKEMEKVKTDLKAKVDSEKEKKKPEKKSKDKDQPTSSVSDSIEMTKLFKNNDKKKEKKSSNSMTVPDGATMSISAPPTADAGTNPPPNFHNGLTSSASYASSASTPKASTTTAPSTSAKAGDIESMEQIEALIQMKKLPKETVTIHSPESGTTIF